MDQSVVDQRFDKIVRNENNITIGELESELKQEQLIEYRKNRAVARRRSLKGHTIAALGVVLAILAMAAAVYVAERDWQVVLLMTLGSVQFMAAVVIADRVCRAG